MLVVVPVVNEEDVVKLLLCVEVLETDTLLEDEEDMVEVVVLPVLLVLLRVDENEVVEVSLVVEVAVVELLVLVVEILVVEVLEDADEVVEVLVLELLLVLSLVVEVAVVELLVEVLVVEMLVVEVLEDADEVVEVLVLVPVLVDVALELLVVVLVADLVELVLLEDALVELLVDDTVVEWLELVEVYVSVLDVVCVPETVDVELTGLCVRNRGPQHAAGCGMCTTCYTLLGQRFCCYRRFQVKARKPVSVYRGRSAKPDVISSKNASSTWLSSFRASGTWPRRSLAPTISGRRLITEIGVPKE